MPHGNPDWWGGSPKETTYALGDMAELAARMGSVVTWDRRGDVLLMDDFRHGISQCERTAYGDDGEIWLDAGWSRFGSLHAVLYGASSGLSQCNLTYTIPRPPYSKIGVEFSFGYHERVTYLQWRLTWYTGAQVHKARVRWNAANATLEYYHASPGWTQFATNIALTEKGAPVNTGKLVVDFVNHTYERFILNAATYAMTDYVYSLDTDVVTPPQLTAEVQMEGQTGYHPQIGIDGFIITQNEP